jgi:hypothetical protein
MNNKLCVSEYFAALIRISQGFVSANQSKCIPIDKQHRMIVVCFKTDLCRYFSL